MSESAGRAVSGLVIVDKPADWTSHDVVGKLRKLARTRQATAPSLRSMLAGWIWAAVISSSASTSWRAAISRLRMWLGRMPVEKRP